LFSYRASEADPVGGAAIAKLDLQLDGTRANWTWDADKKAWLRLTDGRVHQDLDGAQISTANIVVAFSDYRQSPADPKSPELVSVGEGPVWVLTAGKLVKGTWKHASATAAWVLTAADGSAISLTPGRTWVEFPRTSQASSEPQL
jgi:Protein of unknown function (DUF3048) C-terminal domain